MKKSLREEFDRARRARKREQVVDLFASALVAYMAGRERSVRINLAVAHMEGCAALRVPCDRRAVAKALS